MASKKAQFDEYAETSGARIALARAVVALSKASLKDGSLPPATFLRDFFTPPPTTGAAKANLTDSEKATVGGYMKSSGANDLLAKALVALFDAADRPAQAGGFLRDFFTTEAGGPAPPPPESVADKKPADQPAAEPSPPADAPVAPESPPVESPPADAPDAPAADAPDAPAEPDQPAAAEPQAEAAAEGGEPAPPDA